MGNIPIYKKAYMEIKQLIKDGVYPPGTFLPTETELELQFKASRTTIRKAIKLLASEGYVLVMQGRGTEVQDVPTTQKLNKVSSFTETLKQKGFTVTTQGMDIKLITAPPNVQKHLKLNSDNLVYHLQRVQCANGKPIGILENHLKSSLFPDMEKYTGTFTSLYTFLEQTYGLHIKEANEYISAKSSDFIESQILQIPIGTPLLVSKRITFTEKGPFDYSINKSIADKFEYSIYMSGRN